MPGLRKTRARNKALKKFQNSTDETLNHEGRELFNTGFNMGWRGGKKRQRQILDYDNLPVNSIRFSLEWKLKEIKPKIFFNKEKGYWSLK